MIGTIDVKISAVNPNLPLMPVKVFAGSAASFTVVGVPAAIGNRAVTGLSCVYKTKAGAEVTVAAVKNGSAYLVTMPAAANSYFATRGIRFVGSGTDENKASVSWVLGVADLYVLNSSGSVTPGSDVGDVKHSDFANVDADNATLADVIQILKGSN